MRSIGVWIHNIGDCEGGKLDAIVTRAVAAHLGRVLVKISDGKSPWNSEKIKDLVSGLKASGISPWGWAWSYAGSVDNAVAEANYQAHRALGLGLSFFVVDAEAEWETSASGPWATAYCQEFKRVAPQVQLGMTSYWSPEFHPLVPWEEFWHGIDFWSPQTYWCERDPLQVLQTSITELARFGPKLVIPIAGASEDVMPGGAGQLKTFLSETRNFDLPTGPDVWDWDELGSEVWAVIRDANVTAAVNFQIVKVLLNGNEIPCHGLIEGGSTIVDLRPAAEALGATVTWSKNGMHIISKGKEISTSGWPVTEKDGVTRGPLRLLGNGMGRSLTWTPPGRVDIV